MRFCGRDLDRGRQSINIENPNNVAYTLEWAFNSDRRRR